MLKLLSNLSFHFIMWQKQKWISSFLWNFWLSQRISQSPEKALFKHNTLRSSRHGSSTEDGDTENSIYFVKTLFFFLLTHYLSVKLKGSGKYSPLFVTRVVTTAECVILRPNRTDGQQTAAAEQSRQNSNHEPRWEVILRTWCVATVVPANLAFAHLDGEGDFESQIQWWPTDFFSILDSPTLLRTFGRLGHFEGMLVEGGWVNLQILHR